MEEPSKVLIERLNECTDFSAAANEPISETQLVRISYGLVAETVKHPRGSRVWRIQNNKYWTAFHYHFIKYQSDLQERHQTSRQGSYEANNLVRI